VDKSEDDDPGDAGTTPGGGGNPSGWWEFAGKLLDQVGSGTWTWHKTGQLAALIIVLAGALAGLALAGYGLVGPSTGRFTLAGAILLDRVTFRA
jgi:hypothetical protein